MASNYITATALKATLSLAGTTVVNDDIDAAIAAASRAIDNYCGQHFYADSGATVVRYFDASEPSFVAFNVPLVSAATVALDQTGSRTYTAAASTDYDLVPYNAALEGKPYTGIELTPMSTVTFPSVRKGVKVTGQWGWPSVPSDVVEACTILSSRYFKRAREAAFGVAAVGIDGQAIRISRTDPDVASLLEPYRVVRLLA